MDHDYFLTCREPVDYFFALCRTKYGQIQSTENYIYRLATYISLDEFEHLAETYPDVITGHIKLWGRSLVRQGRAFIIRALVNLFPAHRHEIFYHHGCVQETLLTYAYTTEMQCLLITLGVSPLVGDANGDTYFIRPYAEYKELVLAMGVPKTCPPRQAIYLMHHPCYRTIIFLLKRGGVHLPLELWRMTYGFLYNPKQAKRAFLQHPVIEYPTSSSDEEEEA